MKKKSIIGWREWVSLPDLGVKAIKAKVDTGARSSSIHVSDLVSFQKNGQDWASFKISTEQRKNVNVVEAEVPILEHRNVRSSNGKTSLRPIIESRIQLLDQIWIVEISLANRSEMGFRMLLGREAIRGRFLVDSGSSYHGMKKCKGG